MNILALAAALVTFDIPPGNLMGQLEEYSTQAEVSVLYSYDRTDVPTLETRGISGRMTREEALGRLLEDTDLVMRWPRPRTVALVREWPYIDEHGTPYACVPTAWVSGIIFTRLGELLWRLGDLESDLYCTPAAARGSASR